MISNSYEILAFVGASFLSFITDGKRYIKVIDIWAGVADRVAEEMMGGICRELMTDPESFSDRSVRGVPGGLRS